MAITMIYVDVVHNNIMIENTCDGDKAYYWLAEIVNGEKYYKPEDRTDVIKEMIEYPSVIMFKDWDEVQWELKHNRYIYEEVGSVLKSLEN